MYARQKTKFIRPLFFCILLLLLSNSGLVEKGLAQDGLETGQNEQFIYSPDGKYLLKARSHAGRSMLSLYNPDEMRLLSKWEIPNFQTNSLQFSSDLPQRLLISSDKKLQVYEIIGGLQNLIFTQRPARGKLITQASFSKDEKEVIWSTRNSIHASDPEEKKEKKLRDFPDAPITSLTTLKNNLLAVTQKEKKGPTLLSRFDPKKTKELKGHPDKILAATSPKGENLYSLDESNELIRWDLLKNEIGTSQSLPKVEGFKPVALGLDHEKKNLLVLYEDRLGNQKGKKISIDSIEALQPISKDTPLQNSKNNQLTVQFEGLFNDGQDLLESIQNAEEEKGPYHFARVEAENGNYEDALRYIDTVPLESKNYPAARKLQKEVYKEIEIQTGLDTALDQHKQGSYKTAEILLKDLARKSPNNPQVIRLQNLNNKQLTGDFLSELLTILLILLAITLLFYAAYFYREQLKTILPKPVTGKPQNQEDDHLKRQFSTTMTQTKTLFASALQQDAKRFAKAGWKVAGDKLGRIEKAARSNKPPYGKLIQLLHSLQEEIKTIQARLVAAKEKVQQAHQADTKQKEEQAQKERQQQHQKAERQKEQEAKQRAEQQRRQQRQQRQEEESQQQSQAEQPSSAPNYYEILGVSPNATPQEIKKAYRNKVKEYHPDRHTNSDFDWIKDEAIKKTQAVGNAYEVLQDPAKRAAFDRKIRS